MSVISKNKALDQHRLHELLCLLHVGMCSGSGRQNEHQISEKEEYNVQSIMSVTETTDLFPD